MAKTKVTMPDDLKSKCENAINKSNKGKSLVTLIFLSQSEVKKP